MKRVSDNLNSNGLSHPKNDKVEETNLTIDDMPNEMLDAVLRNVSTSDLVNCRHVNRKWNDVSSRVMHQQADIKIVFSYLGNELTQCIQHRPSQTLLKDFWPLVNEVSDLTLSDLVECLKLSKNAPLANFRFKDVIRDDDIESFLSIWGRNITALGVKIEKDADVELVRVLLQKTPNLKNLSIDFGSIDLYYEQPNETAVHLFAQSNKSQLPELKVLRVSGSCNYFSRIIVDIIKEAPNLDCFEKCSLDEDGASEIITAKDLAVLQSLNKLHCLNNVNFLFKRELIDLLENFPQIMDLPLKSFELSITWIWDDQQLSARATKIINKIFESSKNSLLKLVIPPLGLLSGLVIPEFENVRILDLTHDESYEDHNSGPAMFPPLFEMAEHFPNLRELSAAFLNEDNYFSTYEPLQPMRKVELLQIIFETEYDETLMALTPNVKTLLVGETGDHPPAMNFEAIAKHLKTLENLGWHTHAESKENLRSSWALDSIVTGFSTKICKKLAEQFRKESSLDQQTVASYDKYRKKTSILQLRALKRFDMSFVLEQDLDETSDSEFICCEESDCDCSAYDEGNSDAAGFHRGTLFYKSGFTKVSQLFAFNLMPDLDVNIINRSLNIHNKYCSRS